MINSFVGACSGLRDLFYTYTPTQTGALTVSACDQATDANLTIIAGCGSNDTILGCSEFGECFVGTSVQAGVPVIIRVANDQATGPQQFTVTLDPNGIPANDTCNSPTVAQLGDTAFDNTYATTQTFLSCDSNPFPFTAGLDVWFEFTPAITGTYDISTENSPGLSDTQLAIFDSCSSAPFACNDNARGFLSFIRTSLVGGHTYAIVVTGNGLPNGGTPVDRGAGILSIRQSIPPSNDGCESALPVVAGITPYDVYDATTGPQVPSCVPQFLTTSNDIWFEYVPATNGPVEANLSPDGAAGSLALFGPCEDSLPLATAGVVEDTQAGTFTPRLVVTGTAGSPLLFRVAKYRIIGDPESPFGTGNFYVGPPLAPVPANDTCASAPLIQSGETIVSLVNADKECSSGSAQDSCTGATGSDVFYRYTATESGPLSILINDGIEYPEFSGFMVSIYDACGAAPLACSFPIGDAPRGFVQINGSAGQTYVIRVGGITQFATTVVQTGSIVIQNAPVCDSVDFNNDTSLFDPQDIDAFLSLYSEGPCIPEFALCNDIDFNNDGSVFDPCDIDAFLLVFSEGPCTPCGT